MARIEYKINQDSRGNVTIVNTVQRIDPGDEILLVTDTQNSALQWTGQSPFAAPAADPLYLLPKGNSSSPPLQVLRATDMSQGVAQCGDWDGSGAFTPWAQGEAGFPGPGKNSAQTPSSD